jgi:hypothetical protein
MLIFGHPTVISGKIVGWKIASMHEHLTARILYESLLYSIVFSPHTEITPCTAEYILKNNLILISCGFAYGM